MAQSQVAEIKDKIDIVDIIGERISLQRSGKNFRALCPFHSEKSPSFFVSPELQSFICFGCHKKGDAFTFLEEFDRLTFREALEVLAAKAGVELQKEVFDPQEAQRRQLLTILDLAGQYFHYVLTEHKEGERGRAYVQKRGITNSSVQSFGLGYAPPGWDHLFRYLTQKKKFTASEVEATGLIIRGQGGKYYDRFRDRLVFPLHDHRGRIVGFSGRVLDAAAKEAKYINTPETTLYHKRFLLYGYAQNLDEIRAKAAVIIMEGELDMISSVQAHVKHIVAVKGSALTVEQIRLLARTVQTIYLALDADAAGVDATQRAIALIQPFPVALRVIPVAGGKDPDELARQDPAAWREMVKHHVSAFEYVLDHTITAHGTDTAEGQKQVVNKMFALLACITNAVERDFYLKQLSERTSISAGTLAEQWTNWQRQQETQSLRSHRSTPANTTDTSSKDEAVDKLGAFALHLLLHTEQIPATIVNKLQAAWFGELALQRIFTSLQKYWSHNPTFVLRSFAQSLPNELHDALTAIYTMEIAIEEKNWARELSLAVAQLAQRYRQQRRRQVADDLAQWEKKLDTDPLAAAEYARLQKEFTALTLHDNT